jgi:hypothetical protein
MWSDAKLAQNTIKDRSYFPYFKKYALNTPILRVRRRAKHILVDLDNGFTVLLHMKMTGHIMYGTYKENKKSNGREWAWLPDDNNKALHDPYNRHIRVVFTLSNGKHLVFCDSRKFGTIVVEKTDTLNTERLAHLGPEPLEIDELGLTQHDRDILSLLVEKFDGGPIGLKTLAAALSEEEGTLEEVHEPYLMQLGLLERTPRGRVVTERGYTHLGFTYPSQ